MFWYIIAFPSLLASFYCLYKIIIRYFKWLDLKKIPGPECGFWMGQFLPIVTEPFMDPHKRWWKDVGYEVPLMRYSKQFGDHMIVVFDPAVIKEILMAPVHKDDSRFLRPNLFVQEILGRGLVTTEGKEWLHHRRLIQPAFSTSFLKKSLEHTVPDKVLTFLKHWINAGEGHEIDVSSHLSALTLDIIGDAGFSYDCNGVAGVERWAEKAQKQIGQMTESQSPKLSDPLITAFNALMKPDFLRICLYLFGLAKVDNLVNGNTRRVRAALNKTVDQIIVTARREQQSNKLAPKSLLQLLLDAKDPDMKDSKKPALSDLELRDEMKTFLFAGHETTSTWCTWALFALSKHPDVQEKLYQDVMKHGPAGASTKISLEEVDSMEYLAAFLQEVLRLYSPVGLQLRQSRYEEKFAGYTIPKDTMFLIPTHLMHRHPKYWEDPESFSPERFLDSPLANGMDNRGFTFLPFGAGGHGCIGYRFATWESKLIIAHMVRALRVEFAPSQRNVEHVFAKTVITRADPNLKIVVKPRN